MQKTLEIAIEKQQKASDPKDSAWVFASAGSGKTKILVDRVLRLLLDGVAANKILCLTFTKIAAIEMQERISKILASWTILSDDELMAEITKLTNKKADKESLKKARILFARTLDDDHQVKIQTIHAFCQNLVKIFPFEVGIRPNFEIIDENIEKTLLRNAKKEIFLEAQNDEFLQKIIMEISAKLSEESFLELLGKILNKKEQIIFLKAHFLDMENIIEQIFTIFGVKNSDNEEIFRKNFIAEIDLQKIKEIAQKLEESDMKTNKKTAFALLDFTNKQNPEILRDVFFTKNFEPKKTSSIVTKDFEDYKDFIAIFQQQIAGFYDQINCYKNAYSSAILLRFVDRILQKYGALKLQNGFLDYNDLIIESDKLLKNPEYSDWIKFQMDGFFDHVLIDESQDTNHRQWSIIKALTEDFFTGQTARNQNRTIFIIGDDKQSIYSFQGSEPNISHEIYNFYQEKIAQTHDKLHKIDLQNSFRSLGGILKNVDLVFNNLESFKKLEYQDHQAIREGSGLVEIWPQIKSKKQEKDKDFEWKNAILDENFNDEEFCQKELMAEIIVFKIESWIQSKRHLEGFNREINYGDIMVLLRNRTNGFNKILQKLLREKSIPFRGAKKIKFSEEIIIQDLLAAAKFVLLPYDDLNLACLLKSAIFNLSEEELFEICVIKNEKDISLYEAIQGFDDIYQKLQTLIKKSKNLNCYEFFAFLVKDREKFTVKFGLKALQILDQFMIILSGFCTNNLPNLQKFIEFTTKNEPEISLANEHENAVLITTVHSAKGLQAPIVIIPDCCFNFGKMPLNKENFFMMKYGDFELPIWSVKKSEMSDLVKNYKRTKITELKEEYYRLLYVAMTRAENELYIAGFGDDSSVESWYEIVKNSIQKDAKIIDLEEFFGQNYEYFNKKLENFEIDAKILRK